MLLVIVFAVITEFRVRFAKASSRHLQKREAFMVYIYRYISKIVKPSEDF